MHTIVSKLATTILLSVAAAPIVGRQATAARPIPLNADTKLELSNARVVWVEYRGRPALKLAPLVGREHDTDQEMSAVLTESNFRNGVIEVDVAGARRAGYSTTQDSTGFKGIIGLSFRVHGDSAERFYVRPENSRGSSQLFRNRSSQYESDPDYPWNRLRQEHPGEYESYVDVESGAWTKLKIEVSGTTARLYINGASQPCLVVNDLRHGDSQGKIALWARISSDAYFSNLRVEAK